ncbi:MAG TPA: hypothetical protein VG944_06205 [Fimbriimonas sp.]|nr:hypothetical protein [Fimbriimonas sp.]
MKGVNDPHANARVYSAGAPIESAKGAVIALHGRGAAAASMLELASALAGDRLACLAPEAGANTWYPHSFLKPAEQNEPWLSSAIACVRRTLAMVIGGGVSADRIALIGFSQGACLASEFVVRNPGRFGALMALSGGVIGPPGTTWEVDGDLEGTPIRRSRDAGFHSGFCSERLLNIHIRGKDWCMEFWTSLSSARETRPA